MHETESKSPRFLRQQTLKPSAPRDWHLKKKKLDPPLRRATNQKFIYLCLFVIVSFFDKFQLLIILHQENSFIYLFLGGGWVSCVNRHLGPSCVTPAQSYKVSAPSLTWTDVSRQRGRSGAHCGRSIEGGLCQSRFLCFPQLVLISLLL